MSKFKWCTLEWDDGCLWYPKEEVDEYVLEKIDTLETERDQLQAENERLRKRDDNYHELLMAVETKHEGETRHETALRYIKGYQERSAISCVAEAD